jgi:hypothetical protein
VAVESLKTTRVPAALGGFCPTIRTYHLVTRGSTSAVPSPLPVESARPQSLANNAGLKASVSSAHDGKREVLRRLGPLRSL